MTPGKEIMDMIYRIEKEYLSEDKFQEASTASLLENAVNSMGLGWGSSREEAVNKVTDHCDSLLDDHEDFDEVDHQVIQRVRDLIQGM